MSLWRRLADLARGSNKNFFDKASEVTDDWSEEVQAKQKRKENGCCAECRNLVIHGDCRCSCISVCNSVNGKNPYINFDIYKYRCKYFEEND